MDNISGINNGLVDFTSENAKNKVKTDEFEKQLKKAYNEKDEKQLKKVCKDFEQIFLKIMYDQMRASIPKSGLMGESFATDTFEDMYYDRVAEEVANGPGVGLADMLYKNLEKTMKNTYTSADKKVEIKTDINKEK